MAMPLEITPTELRKNVYKLLDKILEGGVPIEVKRKGKRLLITPAEPVSKLERLENHPDCIVGDPEDLVHMDWSKEWTPYI
jgi:hypothetical protein